MTHYSSSFNVIITLQIINLFFHAMEMVNTIEGHSLVWREEKKKKVVGLPGSKEPTIEQVTCDMDCLNHCAFVKPGIACSYNAVENTCKMFDTPFVTFIEATNSIARIRSMTFRIKIFFFISNYFLNAFTILRTMETVAKSIR